MGLELYLDLVSQPCRAVYLFTKRNGISFEFKLVELVRGQHLGEEFGKVNPLQKVPALKDGDFTLAEREKELPFQAFCYRLAAFNKFSESFGDLPDSLVANPVNPLVVDRCIAILLYLARKFKTPDHWYPSDLQKQARVDEYLSWQHTGTRTAGTKVYLAHALVPLFLGHPLPPEKLAELAGNLDEVVKVFEEKFLQDRPFIAGQDISLADLVAIVELMQPMAAGHDVFRGRPKMAAWRSRVEAALGKELFQEAHKQLLASGSLTANQLTPEVKEKLKDSLLKYVQ